MRRLLLLILLLLGAAACAPAEVALPTAAALPTPTVTPTPRPTLPATWTPLPLPTPTVETLAAAPQAAAQTDGRLVFVVDGAVAWVRPDGSDLALLSDPIGARDLALAPGGGGVVFVASPETGGTEVYLLDFASGAVGPVTALNLPDVVDPSWHPNGEHIVFAAGPGDGVREVYSVRVTTAQSSQLTQLGIAGLSDPVFTPEGGRILFAAPMITRLDLASGEVTPLTIAGSVGNDTDLRWRPDVEEALYIQPVQSALPYSGGPIYALNLPNYDPYLDAPMLIDDYVQAFAVAPTGRGVAFASDFVIWLFEFSTRSSRQLAETNGLPTDVAFNPDASRIAFFQRAASGVQLVTVDRTGRGQQVIVELGTEPLPELLWAPFEGAGGAAG